jgi:hypothetical protein
LTEDIFTKFPQIFVNCFLLIVNNILTLVFYSDIMQLLPLGGDVPPLWDKKLTILITTSGSAGLRSNPPRGAEPLLE